MHTTTTISATREAIARARTSGHSIAFVPTMGFLHEGHLSLIDAARDNGADFIVVSIFVNPKQFGPNEDFARYPRDEARDQELLAGSVGAVARALEGERRPGHFEGVATVVLKLFNIVQPDLAVFGRKDAQQCAVIDRMVRDLDLPVRLIFAETAREHDGLARSSRNSYLSPDERKRAPALHRALRAGEEAVIRGIGDVSAVETSMRRMVEETPGIEIDYLAVVDPETFLAPVDFERNILLAGAVRIGRTRLIDNIRVRSS